MNNGLDLISAAPSPRGEGAAEAGETTAAAPFSGGAILPALSIRATEVVAGVDALAPEDVVRGNFWESVYTLLGHVTKANLTPGMEEIRG